MSKRGKIVIIVGSIVLFMVAIIVVAVLIQQLIVSNDLKNYEKLAINNNVAQRSDFRLCGSTKSCFSKTFKLIDGGFSLKSSFVGYNNSSYTAKSNEINSLINSGDYKNTLNETESLINTVDAATNTYASVNQNTFSLTNQVIRSNPFGANFSSYSIINYHLIDGWETATIITNNPNIDAANIVLEKVNGAWKVVDGPDTFFDPTSSIYNQAPQALKDSLNTIYPSAFINEDGTINQSFNLRPYINI